MKENFSYKAVIEYLEIEGFDGVSVDEFCKIFGIDDGGYIIDKIGLWDKNKGDIIMVRDIFCLRDCASDFEW